MSIRYLGFALGKDGMGRDGEGFMPPEAFMEVADGYMRSVRLLTPRYDGRGSATSYLCGGGYSEGELTVCMWYGMLAHFLSWVQDRDAQGQGKAASVWLDGQAYTGVKVASARWNIDAEYDDVPVEVTVSLRGRHGEPERREWPVPGVLGAPIVPRECVLERSLDGQAMSACGFDSMFLTVDNRMGENPVNTRMDGISGHGEIWHHDFQRPVGGEEAVRVSFEPGEGKHGFSIMFPRVVVHTVETDGDARMDGVQAFAGTDGFCPAVVLV